MNDAYIIRIDEQYCFLAYKVVIPAYPVRSVFEIVELNVNVFSVFFVPSERPFPY